MLEIYRAKCQYRCSSRDFIRPKDQAMHGCTPIKIRPTLKNRSSSLSQLTKKNQHRLRAMLNLSAEDAHKIFNILRSEASAREIFYAEMTLAQAPYISFKAPEAFPSEVQVQERYSRLAPLGFAKQTKLLEIYALNNLQKLLDFCSKISVLNNLISSKNFERLDAIIAELETEFGYSHLLLRKACWIKVEVGTLVDTPAIDDMLFRCGIGHKALITTSVVNCFSESQDYLTSRKSILSMPPKGIKGVRNQFTRDIVRQIYNPHAKDEHELLNLLQSTLQSSLIDGLICFKINRWAFPLTGMPAADQFCVELEKASIDINILAEMYLIQDDSEVLFFQRSGAWLESQKVVDHRLLNDLFYDTTIGSALAKEHPLLTKCNKFCTLNSIVELRSNINLVNYEPSGLTALQNNGTFTRSSAFNFILYKNEGFDRVEIDSLLWIMANTCDLAGTINPTYTKRLISRLDSRLSKVILYLLIIKRSRDDLSSHRLSNLLEDEIIENYSSSLTKFIFDLGERYLNVAIYLHEICTEDFLARLTRIIPETGLITETRAALHEWRGAITGNSAYLDRAKAIRIDYKISLVRGEIDDNRIYVDPSRFLDWVSDNVIGEFTPVLTSISHNLNPEEKIDDPQLRELISKCYHEFCSNKHYGIASYIGRRIRHGTFKGHVFTKFIAFEQDYQEFLTDTHIAEKYYAWRARFEAMVVDAVSEKLHIESNSKKEGLIKPNLKSPIKEEFVTACMTDLVINFNAQAGGSSLPVLLLEYCWRIVDLDLAAIQKFIKEMKSKLAQNDLSSDLKSTWSGPPQVSIAFARDMQTGLNRQFKMAQNWFKRPSSVSPKTDINLLYKAVVSEVQETYPEFLTEADYDEEGELQLFGEVYHRIYDALYVVIFNAAKHGKSGVPLERDFLFEKDRTGRTHLILNISSYIRNSDDDKGINSMLYPGPIENISDAQLRENRSGIPKLYNLTMADESFSVEYLKCLNRKVTIAISYRMSN